MPTPATAAATAATPTTATSGVAAFTDQQRAAFERDGFVALPAALEPDRAADLLAGTEDLDAAYRAEPDVGPHDIANLHDLVGRHRVFLDLIDHPVALSAAWRVLGWNIALFHTQLVVTPPAPAGAAPGAYAWHRDNNRMNRELDVDDQPRISLKVAYFLTDVSEPARGNLCVVPGSHRVHRSELPDPAETPDGAVEITAAAGDALVFDRRLWHAASTNTSGQARVALFYGYAYRWVRPKSAMEPSALLALTDDPVRRQLLGACSTANGYYDPQGDDVPLRDRIRTNHGDAAVAR
jgi:ectoine hydroxylase-related dioxygenase (phytanoyl-CoA dioxygenase family)